MPGLLRLAHKMANLLAFTEAKIKISFHPPIMLMRRHGVPDTARMQHGQAHLQLASVDHTFNHQLVNIAFVTGFQRAHIQHITVGHRDMPGWILVMRRRGVQIKFGRIGGIR